VLNNPTLTTYRAILGGILAVCFSLTLTASTIKGSGNLPSGNPNALIEIPFTANSADLVIQTDSWGTSGGFDPVLWVFDSTGTTQLDKDDDICNAVSFPPGCGVVVNRNAMIPNAGDSRFGTFSFSSGTTYLLILSAFDQHYCKANTLCNGVVYPNTGWTNGGSFHGLGTNYDIVFNATNAPTFINPPPEGHQYPPVTDYPLAGVPEPGSAGCILIGGVFFIWRRQFAKD
jgi:hypothetical protein